MEISGNSNVTVGQDVINSIIAIGDHNNFFVGDYFSLKDAYIEPWSVFDRLDLDRFTGREWLLDKVDAFLNSHDRGYFIIEAKAGVGKTAFLAWMIKIKERGYIHHFVELTPGKDGIERGLKNLAAQLILTSKLNYAYLPPIAGQPDYLYKLLKEASEKRRDGEKIVLVVDGLDEASAPEAQNVLGLPKLLPEGIYFIVSHRPVEVQLRAENRFIFPLDAESSNNLDDMRYYLEKATIWPYIADSLKKSHYSSEQFIETLLKKCYGVWIYLRYVVTEIEQGYRSPLDLDSLPDGLTQYYAEYWLKWRDKNVGDWYNTYLPLLSTLAAVREDLTFEYIIRFSQIAVDDVGIQKLSALLNEQWISFLVISNEEENEKYRFYHSTVREFFEGKVELSKLTSAQKSFVGELVKATKKAHNLISEYYLSVWGDLENGLPYLKEKREIDRYYGLRHLVDHLEASGRFEDLHYLLAIETNEKCNLWFEANEAVGNMSGYVNDVALAWNCSEKSYNSNDIIHTGRYIGLQNRYALIVTSVNSLSSGIPPDLLTLLVKNGILMPAQVLAYAQQIQTLQQRVEALTAISIYVLEPNKTQILDEALNLCRQIKDLSTRINLVINISVHLSEAQRTKVLKEALDLCKSIEESEIRTDLLVKISVHLSEAQRTKVLKEALDLCKSIEESEIRTDLLVKISFHLSEFQRTEVLKEALDLWKIIKDDFSKANILLNISIISIHLSETERIQLLKEAVDFSRGITDSWPLAHSIIGIANIAENLPEPLRSEFLTKTLDLSNDILDFFARTETLSEIATHLSDPFKTEVLREAIELCKSADDEFSCAKALSGIATKLSDPQKSEILDESINLCRAIPEVGRRIYVLNIIANVAANSLEPQRSMQLKEILDMCRLIEDESSLIEAFIEVTVNLLEPKRTELLGEAIDLSKSIKDASLRAEMLIDISVHLSNSQRTRVLNEAIDLCRFITDEHLRAKILIKIVNVADHQCDHKINELLNETIESHRSFKLEWSLAQTLAWVINVADNLCDSLKIELLSTALKMCKSMKDASYRAKTLINIINVADNLDAFQKNELLDESIDLCKSITDESSRAEMLTDISVHLFDNQKIQVLNEAIDLCRFIERDYSKAKTLKRIVNNLDDIYDSKKIELLNKILDLCRLIEDETSRVKIFTDISVHLSDTQKIELLNEALRVCKLIDYKSSRCDMLIYISSHLCDSHKARVLNEAIELCRLIEGETSRAKILTDISVHIPDPLKTELLNEALDLCRSIEYETEKSAILKEIAYHLMTVSSSSLYSLWCKIIRVSSSSLREYLLPNFRYLNPLIISLGGLKAIEETNLAIQDVWKWWP